MKKVIIFFKIILTIYLTYSQNYFFEKVESEKVKIYPYIYALNQDKNRILWIGTGNGLYLYDGKNLIAKTLSFISGDNFINDICFINDKAYLALNNGVIVYSQGQKFFSVKESFFFKSAAKKLIYYNDYLWVAIQNKGLYKLNENNKIFEEVTLENILTFEIAKDKFYIGTINGLKIYDYKNLIEVEEVSEVVVNTIKYNKKNDILLVGTNDGLYELKLDEKNYKLIKKHDIGIVRDLILKGDTIFIATIDKGIYIFKYDLNTDSYSFQNSITTKNGLPSDQIYKLYIDDEENLWVGTYGYGLFKLKNIPFILINVYEKDEIQSVTALFTVNNILWFGTSKGNLYYVNIDNPYTYHRIEIPDIENDCINSLYLDNYKRLWIGTNNKGIVIYDTNKKIIFKKIKFQDYLQNSINSIVGNNKYVAVGTKNGLIIINLENFSYDLYSTINGLPHNFIANLFFKTKNKLIVITPTNFVCEFNFLTHTFENEKISLENEVLKFNVGTKDYNNNIWIGTLGNGILCISDTVLFQITVEDGLFSNYIYSIVSDKNSNIYVGHKYGISIIKPDKKIYTYSKNINFYGEINHSAICLDEYNNIWIGNTLGLLLFESKKVKVNKIPPKVLITKLLINDIEQNINEYIELKPGKYKIQFNFVGVALKEPDSIKYKYKLEGYDLGWSNYTTDNYALYPRIDEGNYEFFVEACNEDNVCSEPIKLIRLKILPPFYKRWWFIVISILLVIGVFYLILYLRERNHIRLERILRQRIEERTRIIMQQKELLEQKNKDIMDSINYARRIQEAMLPSQEVFKKYFPNSFIFYLPKEVVSGDFYMVHEKNNYVSVVCGDATGHGVPGAFMSLISMTLLKDIMSITDLSDPSNILSILDKELCEILSIGKEEPQDGVDLIICTLDKIKCKLIISSAMRPFFYYKNNTQKQYHKGIRHSIGKTIYDVNKTFYNIEISYNKGDRIYFFSDGITDQFGMNNKKLKIKGLENWLDELQQFQMHEQYIKINERFMQWKGNNFQIDDVILIGIEFD